MRWLAVMCGVASIVLWAAFAKVCSMMGFCPPLLVSLRDGLGMLFFATAALGSLAISAIVALGARKSGSWGNEGLYVFWGAVFLAVVFLVSGLQFVVVGQWRAVHPTVYLAIKWLLFLVVLTYLILALMRSRRMRK